MNNTVEEDGAAEKAQVEKETPQIFSTEYLVQWDGFPGVKSWEVATNLSSSCADLVQAFEEQYEAKKVERERDEYAKKLKNIISLYMQAKKPPARKRLQVQRKYKKKTPPTINNNKLHNAS